MRELEIQAANMESVDRQPPVEFVDYVPKKQQYPVTANVDVLDDSEI